MSIDRGFIEKTYASVNHVQNLFHSFLHQLGESIRRQCGQRKLFDLPYQRRREFHVMAVCPILDDGYDTATERELRGLIFQR